MKSPSSEASSSPNVHKQNITRELSHLIEHLEADTRRVDDQRFRALLEKSAEVLKDLRKLFERFTPSEQGIRPNEPTAAGRPAGGESRPTATTGKASGNGSSANRPKVVTPQPQDDNRKTHVPGGKTRQAKASTPLQKSTTTTAKPEPVATSKPQDPDEIAAKTQQQRKEARAPKKPGGHATIKPMPPQSGKPIWSKPHSS
jgi:hypothetical protein